MFKRVSSSKVASLLNININFFKKLYSSSIDTDSLLKRLGLYEDRDKRVDEYSKGMKVRLNFVRAMLNNPKILFLDEPTNGLDPLGIEELRDLIKSFPKKGITVILSSHILHEVSLIAEDIGIISNGHLGYEGSIDKNVDLEEKFKSVILEAQEC